MLADRDHFKSRKKHAVTDATIEDASYKLNDDQFIAWKYAVLSGYSNIQISDAMSGKKRWPLPSDVMLLLAQAEKRGFGVPGETFKSPMGRPRNPETKIKGKKEAHA